MKYEFLIAAEGKAWEFLFLPFKIEQHKHRVALIPSYQLMSTVYKQFINMSVKPKEIATIFRRRKESTVS